jgi:copper resistance protein B
MHIKILLAAILLSFSSLPVYAADQHSGHTPQSSSKPEAEAVHAHEAGPFHAFKLETDIGAGQEGTVSSWDFDGWIGGDYNKLWLKSEGEHADGKTEQAELWALYSRNVAEFWDIQAGLRHDFQTHSTSYAVFGFEGLAPYFIETEAHLFVSDEGDVTARLRREHDLLITQRLILQPYGEINLSAQDVEEQEIGAGFTEGEIGLQTRYEITRKFAPYVDLRYERKFGETSSMAKDEGEDNDDFIAAVGLRLMF